MKALPIYVQGNTHDDISPPTTPTNQVRAMHRASKDIHSLQEQDACQPADPRYGTGSGEVLISCLSADASNPSGRIDAMHASLGSIGRPCQQLSGEHLFLSPEQTPASLSG